MISVKIIPPYIEYSKLVHLFKSVAANPDLKSASDKTVLAALSEGLELDGINVLSDQAIDINHDNGEMQLSADYSVKIRVLANISFLLDFHPSSAK